MSFNQKNLLSQMLSSQTEFITELGDKTLAFLKSSETEILFENKGPKIFNLYGYKNDKKAYFFLENGNKVNIYSEELDPYNKKDSLKKLAKHHIDRMKEEKTFNGFYLHIYNIFSFQKNTYNKNKSVDIDSIMASLELLSPEYKEILLRNMNVDDFSNGNIKTCESALEMKEYVQVLNDHKLIDNIYPDDFYIKNSQKVLDNYKNSFMSDVYSYQYLIEKTKESGITEDKPFVFGDEDYFVWQNNNRLFIKDQNVTFMFVGEPENLTVYIFNTATYDLSEELKVFDQKEKEGTLSIINDVVFKVDNGKLTFIDNSAIECLHLDLHYSCLSFERAGFSKREFPVDINSPSYQQDFYYTNNGWSKMKFLASAFLGSVDYDNKTQGFINRSVFYMENLKKEPESPQKVELNNIFLANNFLDTTIVLNAEWKSMLVEFIHFLKTEKPKFIDSDNFSPEIAQNYLNENIKSLETILQNEVKPKSKLKY